LPSSCHRVSPRSRLQALLGDQTPDLIVSDYRLADQETGVALIQQLRLALGAALPGIIVTSASLEPA
jgi:CheY-like chemotaxis protein